MMTHHFPILPTRAALLLAVWRAFAARRAS